MTETRCAANRQALDPEWKASGQWAFEESIRSKRHWASRKMQRIPIEMLTVPTLGPRRTAAVGRGVEGEVKENINGGSGSKERWGLLGTREILRTVTNTWVDDGMKPGRYRKMKLMGGGVVPRGQKTKEWESAREYRGNSPGPVDHEKRTAGVSEKASGKVAYECQEHEVWDVQWTGARQTATEESRVPGSAR
ncbi:hypothetical protein B0H19DRAFT_1062790 [Mycena capillaripes]|nr:hypothetical protein B0H19DRAFT_1062790 [Mycena capillaripes]